MRTARSINTLRTLFVEDNHYLRDVIGELLQDEGLSVISCATADEAEMEFRREPFKLLITDVNQVMMKSGPDLAKRLLSISPNTWVVFLSGYALGSNLLDMGRNVRTLRKPFEVDIASATARSSQRMTEPRLWQGRDSVRLASAVETAGAHEVFEKIPHGWFACGR